MQKIVLFCKSYAKDMFRARRMAESVLRFNVEAIPLYISVPENDLDGFKSFFADIPGNFVTDESILEKTKNIYGEPPTLFPRHLVQQLVKLEFWRMNLCENYAWLDSDSYFIKPFGVKDFFYDEKVPYTMMHTSKDLRQYSAQYDEKVWKNFTEMVQKFKNLFSRTGDNYDFGPPILIWSCKVLQSLYDDYLKVFPKTIYQLLYDFPCEMQLYGEYLLHSKKIPIHPIEPLFKVYHYAEQFFDAQMKGESEYLLSEKYLGVVMQSNWTTIRGKKKNDFGRFKKFLRNLARQLNLIKFNNG